MCPTIEHVKAWSQNLGHEHAETTLTSYGSIGPHRQEELLRSVVIDPERGDGIIDREMLKSFKRLMRAAKGYRRSMSSGLPGRTADAGPNYRRHDRPCNPEFGASVDGGATHRHHGRGLAPLHRCGSVNMMAHAAQPFV
jgi:hypothetical protein